MIDPELVYRRITSGEAGAVRERAGELDGVAKAIDGACDAVHDASGTLVWTGDGATAFVVRTTAVLQGAAGGRVLLTQTANVLDHVAGAYDQTCTAADQSIAYWRNRPPAMPAILENLLAAMVGVQLAGIGKAYDAQLSAAAAVLTGDASDLDLDALDDDTRSWVERGLDKTDDWLDQYGSTAGPLIPNTKATGDDRGLTPQGLSYDPASGMLLQTYYTEDGPSVLSVIDPSTGQEVNEVTLSPDADHLDGSIGHAGGVTVDGDNVYVTDKGKIYTYSLSDMRSSGSGATVQPQSVQTVANGGSYSAMKDGLLYLGTFTESNEGSLHVYQPDGKGGWVEMPEREVTTPPRCQGVIVRDGEYVFATSYGRDNESELVVQGEDGSRESFTFPNMAEGVVEVNGNVLVTYESGADAYAGTDDDLWANPSMTSTPLSGFGLSGELMIGPEALGLVAAELEIPARVLTRTSQDTAGVHLSAGDLGRVPQAPGFAGVVRRMVASISDGLRADCKAVDHAADSLRASERDAMRTDGAVHSGFSRARLD